MKKKSDIKVIKIGIKEDVNGEKVTRHFYETRMNAKNYRLKGKKLSLRKYNPILRKHVLMTDVS
jgi:ribosomal protein L33